MRKSFKLVIGICIVASATVLFMFSPFFTITDVTITGCETVQMQEIIERAGLSGPVNFFTYSANKAKTRIKENLYIKGLSVSKEIPNSVHISVTERRPCGYVEYMQGKYLYIDDDGFIIEIKSDIDKSLPIVTGIAFDKFQLGKCLDVDDPSAFKAVVTYARMLLKHELIDVVSYIDISDTHNTVIRIYNIEVQIGDTNNADEKIRTMKAVIDTLPNMDSIRGFLDIREISSQYIFKLLT